MKPKEMTLRKDTTRRPTKNDADSQPVLEDQNNTLKRLEQSERRYRHLFENMSDAAFLADQATGTIIDANKQAEVLMGLPVSEIIGIHHSQLHPHEDQPRYRQGFDNHIKHGRDGDYDGEVVRRDGTRVPVRITASPFGSNGNRLILSIFKNLSYENEITRKAQESETRFRLAFEKTNEGMCLVNLDGSLLQVNRRMADMLGYTIPELLSMTVNDIACTEDKTLSPKVIEKSLSGEIDDSVFVKRYVHKKGHIVTAKVSTTLVRDAKDKPLYFVSHINDISHEKKRKDEKQKLERQLRQAQKLEAIGTLAGGIAHDFNNILTSIIGYTELALDDAEQESTIRDSLEEVMKAGNRAKDLVQQILLFSREEALEKKPVHLKLIVKEAFKLLRASIPTTIEMNCDAECGALVMGDASQFHQVLMNLCTNASHAMKKTGGRLSIRLKDVTIDNDFIASHPDLTCGPHIILSVEDNGPGIPKRFIEKIFNPFFSTKEKGEGTGLGLSVVHGIVQSCNGGIYVYSEEGKGTVFKVYLPALKKTAFKTEVLYANIPTGDERILLVDDEPALVKMGKRVLESLGYRVSTRTSSNDAIELFNVQNDKFDLVISDMTMPNMDGEKFLKAVKTIRPDMPTILCTGFNSNIDQHRASNIGIDAFTNKPFLKSELGRTVRNVLDRRIISDANNKAIKKAC